MENFTNFEKTLKTYDTSDRQNMYVDILNLSGNKENAKWQWNRARYPPEWLTEKDW